MAWHDFSDLAENRTFEKAIVFIHGLNGDLSTWQDKSNRFVDRLRVEKEISSHFALYVFEYPTKIVEFDLFKKIKSLIPGQKSLSPKEKFNVGVRRIAMNLISLLDELLRDYKKIVLVTHSMGGLIVKRALVEMQEEQLKKIRLFVSLSVPHHGAALATIGTGLLKNPQLIDLKSFSEFTNELTNRFSNLKNKPKAIYQTGAQDLVVNEGSGVPAGVTAEYRIDTDDNHYSVLTIHDPVSHLPYRRLLRELKDILQLEQQESISSSANGELVFTIPENWPFKAVAEALAETAGCTIEFPGFTDQELQILLKSQELHKGNTFQALEALQFIGQSPIPKYQVKITDSHFKIIKG